MHKHFLSRSNTMKNMMRVGTDWLHLDLISLFSGCIAKWGWCCNKETSWISCKCHLQHANVIKLLGCCMEGDERILVCEYMPRSLHNIIQGTSSELFAFRSFNCLFKCCHYYRSESRCLPRLAFTVSDNWRYCPGSCLSAPGLRTRQLGSRGSETRQYSVGLWYDS